VFSSTIQPLFGVPLVWVGHSCPTPFGFCFFAAPTPSHERRMIFRNERSPSREIRSFQARQFYLPSSDIASINIRYKLPEGEYEKAIARRSTTDEAQQAFPT